MSFSEGMGVASMWGVSPAFDCIDVVNKANGISTTKDDTITLSKGQKKKIKEKKKKNASEEPLNILLAQAGDIRHVIKTLAQRRRHAKRPVHFYLSETTVECFARHLVLFRILADWELPIRYRTNVFLEVYGNANVQKRTEQYIASVAKELEKLLCDGEGESGMDDLFDFSLLKYKTRDELQKVFQTWSDKIPFNTVELRDKRLRTLYKDRYDFRKNIIDWDYQEIVRPLSSIIHIKQYREWRQSGTAYEFGDQVYNKPNRTMASYAEGKERGLSHLRRGFWCNIVTSPFLGFGIDSEMPNRHAAGLFEIYNKDAGSEQHRHHAVEVAVHNVLSYLYEIESGCIYKMKRQHQVYSGLGGNETTSGDKEVNGDEPTVQEEENDEADQVDGDKQSEITPTEIYETNTNNKMEDADEEVPKLVKQNDGDDGIDKNKDDEEKRGEQHSDKDKDDAEEPIQSIDTPAVKKMKKKELTMEEQLAQGDGKYDSDDDEDEEEEEEEEEAKESEARMKVMLESQDTKMPLKQLERAPVVQKVEEKEEVFEETEVEKERREFEERAAIERAVKIMEVLSGAKIFLMDMSMSDLIKKPKKRYKNLFDMAFFSFLSAGVLGKDGDKIQQFFKPNAVVAVESVKHIVGLKQEQRKAYKINIDAAAKDKAKLIEREDVAPTFWWRDMPEKFVDENATVTDEKKKRLAEEKEKNKLRTKWDNGVAFYQFQS
jgi:dynein assembly factor 3, axonemal